MITYICEILFGYRSASYLSQLSFDSVISFAPVWSTVKIKLKMHLARICTRRRRVAKNVGCFGRRLFVCGFVGVCGFVCQHDNFRTSKRRMMKLAQKSRLSSNLRVIALRRGAQPPKCVVLLKNVNKAMQPDGTSHRTHRAHRTYVRLRRWENQRRLSSFRFFSLMDIRL